LPGSERSEAPVVGGDAPLEVFGASATSASSPGDARTVGGLDSSFFAYLEDADPRGGQGRGGGACSLLARSAVTHRRPWVTVGAQALVGRNRIRCSPRTASSASWPPPPPDRGLRRAVRRLGGRDEFWPPRRAAPRATEAGVRPREPTRATSCSVARFLKRLSAATAPTEERPAMTSSLYATPSSTTSSAHRRRQLATAPASRSSRSPPPPAVLVGSTWKETRTAPLPGGQRLEPEPRYAVTPEGDEPPGPMAPRCSRSLATTTIRVRIVLSPGSPDAAAPSFADGSVDLLHLDGAHGYAGVAHDLDLASQARRAGVLRLRHARPRAGVRRLAAWSEIERVPGIAFSHGHGLGVLAGTRRTIDSPRLRARGRPLASTFAPPRRPRRAVGQTRRAAAPSSLRRGPCGTRRPRRGRRGGGTPSAEANPAAELVRSSTENDRLRLEQKCLDRCASAKRTSRRSSVRSVAAHGLPAPAGGHGALSAAVAGEDAANARSAPLARSRGAFDPPGRLRYRPLSWSSRPSSTRIPRLAAAGLGPPVLRRLVLPADDGRRVRHPRVPSVARRDPIGLIRPRTRHAGATNRASRSRRGVRRFSTTTTASTPTPARVRRAANRKRDTWSTRTRTRSTCAKREERRSQAGLVARLFRGVAYVGHLSWCGARRERRRARFTFDGVDWLMPISEQTSRIEHVPRPLPLAEAPGQLAQSLDAGRILSCRPRSPPATSAGRIPALARPNLSFPHRACSSRAPGPIGPGCR
jgi:hypothetical protein